MQVRHGWSGEVSTNRWAKFDITLEEEDLRRILGEAYETRNLSTSVAYQLLELEAERLVLAKLVARYGYNPAEGRAAMMKLEQDKQNLVSQVYASAP